MLPQVDEAALTADLFQVARTVWQTMLRRRLARAPDLGDTAPLAAFGTQMFTAWSSLTGAWTGSVHLHCDRESALAFSSWLLNDTREPLRDDDVADCLAELSNVVCGNLKVSLPGPTHIGLPAVVMGEDYRLELPGGRQLVRLAGLVEGLRVDLVVVQQVEV